jgi:heterodisulfide reductase subunit A-like polyferredoxin
MIQLRLETGHQCRTCTLALSARGTGRTCTRGTCVFGAIQLVGDHAAIDPKECRACGRCVARCPNHAIERQIEDDAFIQKIIEQIDKLVEIS